jgi:type IV pilus assembly protein PilY1
MIRLVNFKNADGSNGEKVVGSAVLFDQVVNIPTFQANGSVVVNPCLADVGSGRIYAVNYKTGEAVFNYQTGNDNESKANNSRADGGAVVIRRSTGCGAGDGGAGCNDDRVKTVGSGIPSEVVIIIPETIGSCDAMALAGVGGGVSTLSTQCGGTNQRIYWRELL